MELNAVISKTLRGASIGAIKKIQISKDLDLNSFIVVPDRFSLQAEKLIFENLNISSTFNINVVSVSKLANLVLKLAGKETLAEKQLNCVLKVYSILLNYKKELKTFYSSSVNFELAKDIYLVLAQFKASGISPDDLRKDKLDDKMSDLCFIFEKYEEMLNESFDVNDILNLFSSEISESELVKKSNFYFLEFEAITKQVFEILKNLVKNAKSVTVGVAFSADENEYVYEKDIYEKLRTISSEFNIRINSEIAEETFSKLQAKIAKNLFSISKEKCETKEGEINLIGVSDESEEVKRLVEIINFEVKNNGRRYCDFNVVLPQISTFENEIEKYFLFENIPYFVDKDYSIFDLLQIRFLFDFLQFKIDESEINFFAFASNFFSGLDSEDVKKLYSLHFEKGKESCEILSLNFESENLNKFIKNVNILLEKCEKNKNIKNLGEFISFYFDVFEIKKKSNELIKSFRQNGDLKNLKLYEQFESKLEILQSNLCLLNFEEEIEFKELAKMLKEVCTNVKISPLPLAVDCVFVGQADTSFFEEKKIFVFLGCNQGILPKNLKDVGIVCDNDIKKLLAVKIEPTIKTLNKRAKFKLFCDVCLCKEKLFLLLISNSKEQESELVVSLKNKFLVDGKELTISNDFYSKFVNKQRDITFKLASKFNEKLLKKNVEVLPEKIENISQTLYRFNTTSDTKIQDYFKCPFYAFAKNALKIKENESYILNEKDIGNFFHKFCELYILKKQRKENIDIKEICNESINCNGRLSELKENKKNDIVFEIIFKESKALAKELERHMALTDFVAFRVEENFKIALTENINLVGKIDRIDKVDNIYRVIDYKTGSTTLSLSSLYNGTQIQLPLYINACKSMFGDCVSGAYFPIKPSSLYKNNAKLNGYMINEESVVKKLDKSIEKTNKSEVLDLTIKNGEKFAINKKGGICDRGEFYAILKYSKEIAKTCVEESLSGDIPATPIDSKYCKNCYLYKLCEFKFGEQTREQIKNVNNSSFIEILGEDK